MYRIFKLYFLNYYNFFYKKDKSDEFAITRALNLIFINLIFIIFTIIVIIVKFVPSIKLFLPEIKRYGYVYFLILLVIFLTHYILQKKLKKLACDNIASMKYVKKENKTIAFCTIPVVFLVFILTLII